MESDDDDYEEEVHLLPKYSHTIEYLLEKSIDDEDFDEIYKRLRTEEIKPYGNFIFQCILGDNYKITEHLIRYGFIHPSLQDDDHEVSLLQYADSNNTSHLLNLLLDLRANPNTVCSADNSTLLDNLHHTDLKDKIIRLGGVYYNDPEFNSDEEFTPCDVMEVFTIPEVKTIPKNSFPLPVQKLIFEYLYLPETEPLFVRNKVRNPHFNTELCMDYIFDFYQNTNYPITKRNANILINVYKTRDTLVINDIFLSEEFLITVISAFKNLRHLSIIADSMNYLSVAKLLNSIPLESLYLDFKCTRELPYCDPISPFHPNNFYPNLNIPTLKSLTIMKDKRFAKYINTNMLTVPNFIKGYEY